LGNEPKGDPEYTDRIAALSSNCTPLLCTMRTESLSKLPSERMVKETVIGWLKPLLTCLVQINQIFCCTAARYQSPAASLPLGEPGPGGPMIPTPPGTTAVPVPLDVDLEGARSVGGGPE